MNGRGSSAQGECLATVTVIRATALPSTDLLSKIDAYVKVKVNNALIGKTFALDDCSNPAWSHDLAATLPLSASRTPTGLLEFELWDHNTLMDTHVGTATLDLSTVHASALAYQELAIDFKKDRHAAAGAHSRLVVGVTGWVASFGSLLAATRHQTGALFNTVDRRAYLPLPCPELPPGTAFLAIEYESKAVKGVDIKLLLCVPNAPLHVDLFLAGRAVSKVRRRVYHNGLVVLPGLTVFEEVKLDDLPLSTDFCQLQLIVCDKALAWSGSADQVVSAHGWRGALGFQDACRVLHHVDIDHKEQEIFMRVDGRLDDPACLPEVLLVVDWDKSDVDIKLAVLDNGQGLSRAWDLTLTSGQTVKKTTQVFCPPLSRVSGKYACCRVSELDDVALGTSFAAIQLHCWQLSNMRAWAVGALAPLK